MTEHGVRLGTVQETLLIPLYGRAVESRKKDAALRDARAEEIVASIDYDFARFDNGPSLIGTVLRTSLFDRWVADSLTELTDWRPGTRLLASHTLTSLPTTMYDELPAAYQEMLSGLKAQRLPQVEEYRINLLRLP
ncbi:hypothetical protein [Streptomyces sp. HC307]|uniref:hypothetical protein n=1 Tax=Streptomyces flavusporus TaxID=3385496 RepID=UPI003916CF4A